MERGAEVVLVGGRRVRTRFPEACGQFIKTVRCAASLSGGRENSASPHGRGVVASNTKVVNLAKIWGFWCISGLRYWGRPCTGSVRQSVKRSRGRPVGIFATRKREDRKLSVRILSREITGGVTFTDTCDAKNNRRAVGMKKPDNVLDKFWPQMTSERIISKRSTLS